MKIIVGTTNPKKIAYLQTHFPDDEIMGVASPSGVSEQPMTEEETMIGAHNRAKHALESNELADLGVGMEGGSHEGIDGLLYYCCIVVLLDKSGKKYMGISTKMPIPRKVSEVVKAGSFLVTELKKMEEKNELIEELISRKKMFYEAIENVRITYQNKHFFD
jgi:non-canonical (house-cleaning) NTP pyrophosphatase